MRRMPSIFFNIFYINNYCHDFFVIELGFCSVFVLGGSL